MKVKEVMAKKVISLDPEDSVYDAAKNLRKHRISGALVVAEGEILGVLSESDIMKLISTHKIDLNTFLPSPFDVLELPVRMKLHLDETFGKIRKIGSSRVEDIMTKKVITIFPEADINEAAQLMGEHNINRLPVVDKKGKLVGIITRGDIIGAL